MNKINVSIYGGTGFGAGELMRLFIQHPNINLNQVVSSSQAGKPVASVHTNLESVVKCSFVEELNLDKIATNETIFFALPHGVSGEIISKLRGEARLKNCNFIDLSGDFRFQSAKLHEKFYSEHVYPELRKTVAYGLPELNAEKIKQSNFIANPGCYPTASVLAIAPVKDLIEEDIIVDAKSGSSGAGRGLNDGLHHSVLNANSRAYKILEHRHEPEINTGLGDLEAEQFNINFVPHLLPISRGMLVTVYVKLKSEMSQKDLENLYQDFYAGQNFVRLRQQPSEIRNVAGSNFCDLYFKVRGKQLVITSAIDNLIKGMAGQAIQNFNLINDLPETSGLEFAGLGLS